MTFNPHLVFYDEWDNLVTDKYFESVRKGESSKIHILKLKNLGDPCKNIIIRSEKLDENFSEQDTNLSTYLSLNMKDYSSELKVSLNYNESILFYLKWQPPSNALSVINAVWGLSIFVDMMQEQDLSC